MGLICGSYNGYWGLDQKSYKEFCNYVQNNAYTIERENSDHEINIFDVYSESSNGSVFNYESDSGDSTDENSK